MHRRIFGVTEREISVIGYGAASLSTESTSDEAKAASILKSVVSLGVALIDTADTYCPTPIDLHHNERLIFKCLADRLPHLTIATKGGTVRTHDGWAIDGNPERLYQAICESYEALGGRSPIPLWQHHWPDPRFSIAEMLEPARRAQAEGLIQWIGVGNYNLDQLRQACDCVPVVSIQNQYNLWNRTSESDGVLDFCENRRLIFLSWRPLGGSGLAQRLSEINVLARLAADRNISPQRLVIAWQRAQSPCIIPLMGSTNPDHLADCLAAAELSLDSREMALLNHLRPEDLPRRTRPPAWLKHPPLSEP